MKEKEFDVEALIKISKEAQGEVKDLKRGNAKNKEGLFVSEDLEHDLGSQAKAEDSQEEEDDDDDDVHARKNFQDKDFVRAL